MSVFGVGDLNATLIEAASAGGVRDVERMLSLGADIHALEDSALLRAAENGHAEVVNVLLNAQEPADIHARNDGAFRMASANGHAEVVKLLLNARDPANIHVYDDVALRLAAFNGHVDVVDLLLKSNDPPDNLAIAFALTLARDHPHGRADVIRILRGALAA